MQQRQHYRGLGALVAAGGSLAAFPAAALELQDISVHSRLGQPLRASIAYALAPNEAINSSCVSLAATPAASGLPGIGATSISVANGVISLIGEAPLREPMVSVQLNVRCPYSANLSREYMMFIDPPSYVAPEATVATRETVAAAGEPAASAAVQPAVRPAAPTVAERPAAQPRPVAASIPQGERYQVRYGDTLSTIAARIEDRKTTLWPTVNALFDANPDAFIDADPNKLKAGAWLVIPASIGGIVSAETAPVATSAPVADIEPAVAPVSQDSIGPVADSSADLSADTGVNTDALLPGDVAQADYPAVQSTGTESTVVIPDTTLEGPTTTASNPNVPAAVATPKATPAASKPWAWWLGGAGLLALLALFLFGRRLRGDSTPAEAVAATPMRRRSDTQTAEAIIVDEGAYEIADDSPTEENLVLDADLTTGTGLDAGTAVDLNREFGFADVSEPDIELPPEPEDDISNDETGNLPVPDIDESGILEALPEDDEYDMSVIVDATRMADSEEATERDLKAVEIRSEDEDAMTDEYTIDHEIDYQILEQDYEDELTATQALNQEISRAAAELTERMNLARDVEESDTVETAVLPMTSVAELDVTTEMPAANADEVVELDETAAIEVDETEATANMEIESGKRG